MQKLKYAEIRESYLGHFKKYGHAIINSAPLVPENDPTILFVNSGMFPLVPFLLGEEHPEGTRLTNSQRCVRTIDIDEVGDNTHATTFEMLGNWSLNDYFKEEAIPMTVEFFVDGLGFEIERLYGSVFQGEEGIAEDMVSVEIWKKVFAKYGIDAKYGKQERVQPFDRKDTWWELPGGGPCGPCSEIFYDMGGELCGEDCNINCDCGKYVEIGNNVLMEYLKKDGEYLPLGRHNIDFGGGLDRLAMLSQGVDNFYDTDIYKPILDKVRDLAESSDLVSERIIVDHVKAATWMITDGVQPGKTEREYILRRLIRRAIRRGRKLGIQGPFIREVAEVAINQFTEVWEKLSENKENTIQVLIDEEQKFNNTLDAGLKEVEKVISQNQGEFKNEDGISFKLYETYGFPAEMLVEELKGADVEIDLESFWKEHEEAFAAHQDKSRSSAKGMFKGGLADVSDASKKLHSATHLLLAALYKVVGDNIYQKGSNITPDRLRLDFPNDSKLTPEQLAEVENMVNKAIEDALPISWVEKPKDEALAIVQYAAFEERYGDVVKVYTIGEGEKTFSVEICNGPHVDNTKELGRFKIVKHENVAAGIKRIKAILE